MTVPARILVIEDNAANMDLMTYLLKAYGHLPSTACQGDEGLAMARQQPVDLIVCDIQLPGMDGYAVAGEIKADAALRKVPIVAVTALAMVGDRSKVLAAGFDGYVSKPIDPEAFVPAVEAYLPRELRSVGPVSGTAGDAAPSAAGRKRATVLVVDDAPDNLELLRSLLGPLGYEVLTASRTARALEIALERMPDLILFDVGMVDGNGFDFIKQVKAEPRLKDVPFVFLTATHWASAARDKGMALGATRFLLRPLDSQQLLAEIEACLLTKGAGDRSKG